VINMAKQSTSTKPKKEAAGPAPAQDSFLVRFPDPSVRKRMESVSDRHGLTMGRVALSGIVTEIERLEKIEDPILKTGK
jgi:hypothetical protein